MNKALSSLCVAALGGLLLASPAAMADVPPRPHAPVAPVAHDDNGTPAAHGEAAPAHGEAAPAHGEAAPAHGEAAPGEHGANTAHGGGHADPATDYVGDDDGDGIPNWRDSDAPAYQLTKLLLHGFNLAFLVGLLWWLAGRAISDALKNRAANIRKSITDAATMKAEAEARFAELEARLAAFEGEVATLREQAAADAQEEEARLVAHAQKEAERILVAADHNIRDELVRARMALRAEAVDLAVKLATETLQSNIGSQDHQKLASEFLGSLNHGVNGNG